MKKILITGANGQLGRALQNEYKGEEGTELILTDVGVEGYQSLDITALPEVDAFFAAEKPDVVINAAAFTNVNAAESAWDAAYRVNAIGPRNLAIAAEKYGAKLVHVSTDYVFDGTAAEPYTEFDAPAPLGAYGKTKYAGEEFVKQFSHHFFIVRTAWLYGDGKNFVRTMLGLAETHDTVSVVHDQIGSIFHGTCEGYCSWAEFTEEIFRLAGVKTEVKRVTTDEYPTPAKRPAYSVLENYMLKLTGAYTFADWHDAIRTYMEGE